MSFDLCGFLFLWFHMHFFLDLLRLIVGSCVIESDCTNVFDIRFFVKVCVSVHPSCGNTGWCTISEGTFCHDRCVIVFVF